MTVQLKGVQDMIKETISQQQKQIQVLTASLGKVTRQMARSPSGWTAWITGPPPITCSARQMSNREGQSTGCPSTKNPESHAT